MVKEIWRDVKNYEGLYCVSNKGKIKSLARIDYSNHLRKERILKPGTDCDGYLLVALYKKGKRKTFKVHRLVAENFLENPHNYPQCNHIDEDKKTTVWKILNGVLLNIT